MVYKLLNSKNKNWLDCLKCDKSKLSCKHAKNKTHHHEPHKGKTSWFYWTPEHGCLEF